MFLLRFKNLIVLFFVFLFLFLNFFLLSNDEFRNVATDVRENGFHWLHKVNPEDRPVHQVTKGNNGKNNNKRTNHFPKNRMR